MTVYDSYTILNPTPGKYEADHPLVIGVNQSRVKTTINVPEIFAAGRYYFRGVNTVISGVVASDAGKPAYIEANLQDGEIGAGTLMLLSVHGVEANFPYSIKHVPLFETEIDAGEIDTSGLVTKDTFNSTVARIDADIQKGDTDLRLDLDALTSRFTQLSSEVNAELDTFDESLGQLDTDMKNLAAEVDGYDARITNAENAASSANTVAQVASSAASAAQTTADEAKAALTQVDAKVTQLAADVETAEVTANTANTTADEAKTNADDAVQRAINARLEANKANDAVKLVQADLDKLEETVSTGSSDLTALTGRVTTAEGKITTLEGKVTTAESDISAVETTTAHLTDNLNQLTTSVTETKGKVAGLEVNVIDLTAEVDTLKTRGETTDNDISGLQTSVSDVGAIATKAQNDATQAIEDAAAAQSTANEAKLQLKNLAPSYSLEGPITQTLDSSYRAVLDNVDLTSSYWLEVVAGATNQLFSALTVIINSNNILNTRIILDGSIKGDAGNLMFTAAILPMFGLVDIQPIDDKNFASSRDGRPPSGTSRIGNITVIAKGTEVAGATIRLYRVVTNYGG